MRPPRGDRERGVVMFWLIPMMIGLLALAGLVVDGGTAIATRERAEDVAQQAARAGADALPAAALRAGDPANLASDPGAARAAAQRVLEAAGITDPRITVSGTSVTVSVTVREPTRILSAFGLNTISGTASATALALHGTSTGGTG